MIIQRKLINVKAFFQPNQVLIHKPPRIRLVIPEEVVMQPRFKVAILVLQAEGLVCAIRYLGFFFQTAPAGVVAEPNQITFIIGHLTRDADLVAVEVVGLLAAFAFGEQQPCAEVVRGRLKSGNRVRATVCYKFLLFC